MSRKPRTSHQRVGGSDDASTGEPDLSAFNSIAEAIATLLHPHAEVVLHDMVNDRIAGIWNAFSNRKVGDPSNLANDPSLRSNDAVIGPYEKAERDGSRIKSISVAIPETGGARTGFLCINLDLSKFDAAIDLLRSFTSGQTAMPDVLFKGDLREQVNLVIRQELIRLNKSMNSLTREDRLEIIRRLDEANIFHARNGVPIVASTFGIGRTNVYHMLRAARSPSRAVDAA